MSDTPTRFNADHSANASVTLGTYRGAAFGLHPDLEEKIEEIRKALPDTLLDNLNGWAALYTSNNGVIFALIVGTGYTALRLPPDEIQRALADGAVRSIEGKRSITNSETYKKEYFEESMIAMGDDWVILQSLWRIPDERWRLAHDYTAKIAPEPIKEKPLTAALEAENEAEQRRAENLKGIKLRQQERWDEAIAQFTAIIQSNPTYLPAYFERADTYQRQGKLTEAIADLTHVIEFDPTHYLAYHLRGDIYRKTGQSKAAQEDYQQSIKFISHNDTLYYADLEYIAQLFEERGDLDGAIATYSILINERPEPSEVAGYYKKRGYLYERQWNYGKAIADFEKAVAIYSDLAAKKPFYLAVAVEMRQILRKRRGDQGLG